MTDIQRTESSVLKMVEIDGKGRGLVASQPLKAGEILMQETPIYAYFVSPLKQEVDTQPCTRFCAHCYRSLASSSSPLTCPSCCSLSKDTVFCSSKCLSLSLTSTHTPWVCQTLSTLRNCSILVDNQTPNPNPNQQIQIQARCLVAVFNLAMVSLSKFQAFLSLDGCGVHDEEEGYVKAATFLHSVFSSSVPFPEMSSFSLPSVEMIADILAKDWRNSFCLMEPFSEERESPKTTIGVRGYALYLNASLFNHSCLPNACHFNYLDAPSGNTDRIMRLMRDVGQGEEICISYLRVNLSYSERQRRLMNDYTFVCVCERCKVEANNSDLSLACSVKRFMCKNCRGFLAPLPPSIDGCPSEFVECNICGNLTKRQDEP